MVVYLPERKSIYSPLCNFAQLRSLWLSCIFYRFERLNLMFWALKVLKSLHDRSFSFESIFRDVTKTGDEEQDEELDNEKMEQIRDL